MAPMPSLPNIQERNTTVNFDEQFHASKSMPDLGHADMAGDFLTGNSSMTENHTTNNINSTNTRRDQNNKNESTADGVRPNVKDKSDENET